MSIRDTERYKTLVNDSFRAAGLAEGFIDGSKEDVLTAWQVLHDTHLAYRLQGWFGRTAQSLIREGVIEP